MEPTNHENKALELGGAQLRELIDRVAQRLEVFVDGIESSPASREGGVSRLVDEPMPKVGAPLDDVLDLLFSRVIPSGYNTTSPGFLGYFGGGGIPQAAVADLIAGTVNRFVGRWAAAPEAVQLESNVIRWFADMVGYPATSRGVLTSGGSMSNLTALFTARQRLLHGQDLRLARFYASDQSHFSLRKAAMVCGLPNEAFREVPTGEDGRMDVDALDRLVREDRAAGFLPFLVVATGGTFNTGAVDDVAGICALARRERLWCHLDAAYGGFFVLTGQGRALLAGLDQCDSITLDPHKSFFLPYGTGALLVRDGRGLKQAHAVDADFYGPLQDDPDCIDFCSHAMEQTRAWRGLRIWLPLKLHGIAPFRANLEEKLALAAHAAEALQRIPGIELVAKPALSVLAFRLVRPGCSPAELQRLNERLLAEINRRGHIFLMGSVVRKTYALRMCLLSFRTHIDRLESGIADVHEAARSLQPGA
ncbi:aminotransferase class I/II-fold pyridoxal phosphate-dependent enzyme [Rhizobacter sp. Root1221]|uniref:pyridoxal phosphate-dependent decarboxylase family protein n=1 Tax=Rhizobacter sp. Root1221 TaxID=1736433 RepID=UPI0006FB3D54|nr:aminotransferase class I/II-fold pyridoxal phosphate-dependent enzyme [Rhizobacter sp. Root1221]KQV90438.1 hypothetical protein ASC87_28225 [Rhizobacter sp. Root1221]